MTRRSMNRYVTLLLVGVLMALGLAGCGGGPGLRSIEIIPNNVTFGGIGLTAQLQAIGHYSKANGTGSTQDLTSQVQWKSASTDVATVDSTGKVTSKGAGVIQVTATMNTGFGPVVGTVNVTVNSNGGGPTARDLLSIAITPASQTLTTIGQTTQFIAIGTYSAPPTTQDITAQVTWQSSTTGVATIGLRTGLATAVGSGTTTITATGTSASGANIVGTATLTETAAVSAVRDLVSVSVIPTSQTLTSLSQTAQFTAVGTYSAPPSPAVITSGVTWSSSVPQVATINSSTGLATATGPGTTAITATATTNSGAKIAGTATLTEQANLVTARDLVGLSVIPTQQLVPNIGDTAQFIAVGTYSSAPVTDILRSGVQWSSTITQVATIDATTGLATAVGPGTTTILATAPSASGAMLVGQGILSQGVGPSQLPTLTVVKLGVGAAAALITSNPASISCGSTCNATFPLGSTVTLTAAPVPASWSGNCLNPQNTNGGSSSDGSQCTVTMANNTVVAAVFN